MAENHPVGFRWVIKARERGATVIHVDPRFTRTSAMADIWVPLRAGSDIVFLGALVNHVLSNGLEFRDYVVAYTNAATIISKDFRDTEDLEGFFSGWDPDKREYSSESWAYEGSTRKGGTGSMDTDGGGHGKEHGAATMEMPEHPPSDPTLEHPRCVFQLLKQHFARYTPEMVEEVCGVPQEFVPAGGRRLLPRVGTGQDGDDLLRPRLDAALDGRADDPHGGDPAAAARQYRPPGRRHPRAARPRVDPGIDRHPDALRHSARLPADAEVRRRRQVARHLHREAQAAARRAGATSTTTSSRC